ncbi:MAG: restriction endonuclease [Candidatus Methanomethylicaceae archaeon]
MTLSLMDLEERLKQGESLEEILRRTEWRDFEELTSAIMREAGFLTIKNFRFSSRKKRYEVDVIALENPRIILVDCKKWDLRVGKASGLKLSASRHLNRSLEFLDKLQEFREFDLRGWKTVIVIPILVTLYEEVVREYGGVLVVPVFKMTSFLESVRSGVFDQISRQVIKLEGWVL